MINVSLRLAMAQISDGSARTVQESEQQTMEGIADGNVDRQPDDRTEDEDVRPAGTGRTRTEQTGNRDASVLPERGESGAGAQSTADTRIDGTDAGAGDQPAPGQVDTTRGDTRREDDTDDRRNRDDAGTDTERTRESLTGPIGTVSDETTYSEVGDTGRVDTPRSQTGSEVRARGGGSASED